MSTGATSATGLGLRIEAGPDAFRSVPIGSKELVIGHRAGPGMLADPALEVHHLVVRQVPAPPPGEPVVEVLQVAGRAPVRVDDFVTAGWTPAWAGSVIELGTSRLVVSVGRQPPAGPAGSDRRSGVVESGVVELGVVGCSPAHRILIRPERFDRWFVIGPGSAPLVRSITCQVQRWGRSMDQVDVVAIPDPAAECPDPATRRCVVIRLGVDWRATLERLEVDGSMSIRRFHAAGLSSAVRDRSG